MARDQVGPSRTQARQTPGIRGASSRTGMKPEARPVDARTIAVALVVGAIAIFGGITWLDAGTASEPAMAQPSLGAAATASPEPAAPTPVASPAATPDGPPPFLDPAGAAALAYGAGEYTLALEKYREAVARHPGDAESHSNLGQVLVRIGQVAESLPHFDTAIAANADRWAYHFNRARALALLERWDDAITGYRRAQELFPGDYAIAFNLAQTYHRKGDEVAAVEQYLRAIELDPEDASFRLALGISYEKLQKRAEAAAAYEEYLRLAPAAPDAEKVRARIGQLTAS
jgi:tetratricopeptide (TPR) repeat protein